MGEGEVEEEEEKEEGGGEEEEACCMDVTMPSGRRVP